MENASKALLMAAAVLVAMMIISIATYLFSSASEVTKTYDTIMQTSEVAAFNAHFNRFIGGVKDNNNNDIHDIHDIQKYATIYDVISLANFADNYNRKIEINPTTQEALQNPTLVRIDLESIDKRVKISNLQNHSEIYNILMEQCYYQDNEYPNASSIVTYEITINSQNAEGKINHVTFSPMSETQDTFNGLDKAQTQMK